MRTSHNYYKKLPKQAFLIFNYILKTDHIKIAILSINDYVVSYMEASIN